MSIPYKKFAITILAILLIVVTAFSFILTIVVTVLTLSKLDRMPSDVDGFLFLAYWFGLVAFIILMMMILSKKPFTESPFDRSFLTGILAPTKSRLSWLIKIQPFSLVPLLWFCLGGGATSFFLHQHLQPFFLSLDGKTAAPMMHEETRPYLNGTPTAVYIFQSGKTGKHDMTSGEFRGHFTGEYSMSGGLYANYLESTIAKYKDTKNWRTTISSVEVIGYADNTGPLDVNLRLSRERAETVRIMLQEAGVPETIIRTRAVGVPPGACTHKSANYPNDCHYQNRRVEVYFHGNVNYGDAKDSKPQ